MAELMVIFYSGSWQTRVLNIVITSLVEGRDVERGVGGMRGLCLALDKQAA